MFLSWLTWQLLSAPEFVRDFQCPGKTKYDSSYNECHIFIIQLTTCQTFSFPSAVHFQLTEENDLIFIS